MCPLPPFSLRYQQSDSLAAQTDLHGGMISAVFPVQSPGDLLRGFDLQMIGPEEPDEAVVRAV